MALGLTPDQIIKNNGHHLLRINKKWVRVYLDHIAEVKNGFAFASKYFTKDAGMPLIRIRDILSIFTENYYSGEYLEEFIVKKGDILIGMDGDFNAAIWTGSDGLLNQRVCKIIPNSDCYSKQFLFLCLQPYLNAINEETSSITVKHLSSNTIKKIPLPLPPRPEQRAIVAKIEQLFSDLDDGIASLKKAREQLKIYRQAVLKKAFEGELTKAWRETQPDLPSADDLLEEIKKEREAIAKSQGKKPTTIKRFTDIELVELPKLAAEWCWVRLDEISKKITDGEHFRPKTQNHGVYFLSAKDVKKDGVSFDDPLYISKSTAQRAIQRCKPEREDILIVSRGATVGRMCIVNTDKAFCLLGSVILIKVSNCVNSSFLNFILKSPIANQKMVSVSGATAQQAIYLRDIKNIAVPFCSQMEQHQIVQEIETRLSVCDNIEANIKEAFLKAKALRQSILKKAFEGKLLDEQELAEVRSAPDWEPAEKLLERIKEEKAAKKVAR